MPQTPGPGRLQGHRGSNVKVNANCLNLTDTDLQGRGQAQNETWIAVDPNNSQHLVGSYNDYRRGDGTCGVSYSLNGGRTWADTTTPNGFTRGDFVGTAREYWQASGDTSVAWDTKGNAYLSCQVFNRGDGVSPEPGPVQRLLRLPLHRHPGRVVQLPRPRRWRRINDTAGAGNSLLDKQLLTVDNNKGSKFADRVYVTWTTFAADGTGYIYEAYSKDYGESFSAPVLVSRNSRLCGNTFGLPTPQGKCNENQDSQPFVGTGRHPVRRLQQLQQRRDRHRTTATRSCWPARPTAARASPPRSRSPTTTSCPTATPTRAPAPTRAAPACRRRARATTRSSGPATTRSARVDPTDPNRVVVTFGSYINRNSNENRGCTPTGFAADGINTYTGVKDGGCNNDIVYSVSGNGGGSFSGGDDRPAAAAGGHRRPEADQHRPVLAGRRVHLNRDPRRVSYYDRSYGDDNTTGYSDITVSASHDRVTFAHKRATSSSMPPPTQFAGQFYGDYAGHRGHRHHRLPAVVRHPHRRRVPLPRHRNPGAPPTVCSGSAPNAPFANDQDIYTAGVPIP